LEMIVVAIEDGVPESHRDGDGVTSLPEFLRLRFSDLVLIVLSQLVQPPVFVLDDNPAPFKPMQTVESNINGSPKVVIALPRTRLGVGVLQKNLILLFKGAMTSSASERQHDLMCRVHLLHKLSHLASECRLQVH